MSAKILIVDDHPANLLALEAVLEPLSQTVIRASSGEEALRRVLQTPDFAVILLDVKMPVLDGFETAAIIRGRALTREIPIIFLTGYDNEFRQARRAYDLGAFDYIIKPFDGEILRHKVAAFVRIHEQSEQMRRQAEELQRRQSELLEARETTRLRDMSAGVLGHDLRNPLNAVSIGAALLHQSEDLPARHRTTVERMIRSAARMEHLINDVLDFTRGNLAGGIPVVRRFIDLDAVWREVVEEFQSAHPDRRIVYSKIGDATGEWDPARAAQVASNLVGNALQHCRIDPIQVVIDGSGATIRISVTNSGSISPDILPHLFEPFRRGGQNPKSLGLGLYIAREIVVAHGAVIAVRSDPVTNETTFVVEHPRAQLLRAGNL